MIAVVVRAVAGGAFGAILVAAVLGLSELRTGQPADQAYLRLGWRLTGQKSRICRTRTDAENATIPPHMRRREDCQERNFDYALKIVVNGTELVSRVIQPAGVHADRPVYVHEDLPLTPGTHRVQVSFEPLEPAFVATLAEAERELVRETVRKAVRFSWDRELQFEAGRILLLTYAPVEGTLVQVGGG